MTNGLWNREVLVVLVKWVFFCALVGVRARVGSGVQGKRQERRRSQRCKGKKGGGVSPRGAGVLWGWGGEEWPGQFPYGAGARLLTTRVGVLFFQEQGSLHMVGLVRCAKVGRWLVAKAGGCPGASVVFPVK